MFGGYSGHQWLDDFYKLCFDNYTWSVIQGRGEVPFNRFGYVSATYDE